MKMKLFEKENLFYLAVISYVVFSQLNVTELSTFSKRFFIPVCVLVVLILAIYVLLSYKEHEINKTECAIYIFLFLQAYAVGLHGLCFVFLLAGRYMDFRKITKVIAISTAAVIFSVMLAMLLGIIENVVENHDGRIRFFLGFLHPNSAGACLVAFLLSYSYWRERNISHVELLFMLSVSTLMYRYTDSRASFLICVLIILVISFLKYGSYLMLKSSFIQNALCFSFVFVSVFSVYTMMAYNPEVGWMKALDNSLSGRIYLSCMAWKNEGIHFLATSPVRASFSDYIIDNCYSYYLIRQGILPFFFYVSVFTMLLVSAKKRNDWYLLVLLSVVSLYGFAERIITNYSFNPFWLAIPMIFREKERAGK